jgi:hypothetical protein
MDSMWSRVMLRGVGHSWNKHHFALGGVKRLLQALSLLGIKHHGLFYYYYLLLFINLNLYFHIFPKTTLCLTIVLITSYFTKQLVMVLFYLFTRLAKIYILWISPPLHLLFQHLHATLCNPTMVPTKCLDQIQIQFGTGSPKMITNVYNTEPKYLKHCAYHILTARIHT